MEAGLVHSRSERTTLAWLALRGCDDFEGIAFDAAEVFEWCLEAQSSAIADRPACNGHVWGGRVGAGVGFVGVADDSERHLGLVGRDDAFRFNAVAPRRGDAEM